MEDYNLNNTEIIDFDNLPSIMYGESTTEYLKNTLLHSPKWKKIGKIFKEL